VLGYRIALIVTGSLALVLADQLPWPVVYLLMALLMLVGVGAAVFAPEPVMSDAPPQSMREAVIEPFVDFFRRTGPSLGVVILVFVVFYQLPDRFVGNMVTPFLLQVGFTQTEVGAIQGGIGMVSTILGVLAGGAVIAGLGINRSVWIFAVVQILSNLAYYWISLVGQNRTALIVATVMENVSGGLVTAVFVAYMMSLSSRRFSATQYALLSSMMTAARDIIVTPAGAVAEATGWPTYFLLTLATGIPALLLLPVVTPWGAESPRGAAEHTGVVREHSGEVHGPAVEEGGVTRA
jgi:PAT family beta-lactamase induction signal transducer AmpG